MQSTPPSLLERLRHPDDQEAWNQFVEFYTPLLYQWTRGAGLQESDAADLLQEVFMTLLRKIPEFQYDPARSFRAWLRTLALNQWRDHCRRRGRQPAANNIALEEIAGGDSLDDFHEAEYRKHLVAQALRLMQVEFEESTWKACWEFVVRGHSAAEVARKLSISENAVYVAKSRVIRRLRQELEGLID